MALVGGLILSISSAWSAKHSEKKGLTKIIPQLFFNAGRLVGFFIFGGLLGMIGKSFTPSPLANGILNLLVGVIIIAVGLSLISTRFKSLISLPKFFARKISHRQEKRENKGHSSFRTMTLGALTFFLPCGFTQAMQLYAISSGNFIDGALAMSLFALGTTPGLLGIGILGGKAGSDKKRLFFKIVSILIIAFGMINAASGTKLIRTSTAKKQITKISDDTKNIKSIEIHMTQLGNGYSPNYFVVELGQPIKWIIDSKTQYSCASSLVIPSLGIKRQLKLGQNVIEFTPTEKGNIPFSCSMGMYSGTIEVIEKISQTNNVSCEVSLNGSPTDCPLINN
jgi:sulfite exporter TauE/SafE